MSPAHIFLEEMEKSLEGCNPYWRLSIADYERLSLLANRWPRYAEAPGTTSGTYAVLPVSGRDVIELARHRIVARMTSFVSDL